MKVTLKGDWFAPSTFRVGTDKIFKIGGQHFSKGTHVLPDGLRPYLPSSAVVHEEDEEAPAAPEPTPADDENLLRAFDADRAAGDAESAAREKAERFKQELENEHAATRKAAMRERMQKVRAAKFAQAG